MAEAREAEVAPLVSWVTSRGEEEEKEEEEAQEQTMEGGDSSLGEAACFRGWNAARRAENRWGGKDSRRRFNKRN